ncbi:conserved hypothetical protein [Gammaproteobacteria bacterium]
MNNEIELILLKEIEELKKQVATLKGQDENKIPTYQYSKIRDVDLKTLFDIEKKLSQDIFNDWFNNDICLTEDIIMYLQQLIEQNSGLVDDYNEEDLKIYLISPLLNKVNFLLKNEEIRGFYELPMNYTTDRFILNGTVDFVISKGLFESKKPYFFIQEFKRSEEYGNPRPQLLAELITAVELNGWKLIKGAYIIGGSWHFAILEKLSVHKYQYFVSKNFDSTKIEDLKLIYKNLLFIKNEILSTVM